MMLGSSPILVVDLEATCANDGSIAPEEMEVIEVGAAWSTLDGTVLDTFQRFVRPAARPQLTAFCMELTHIEQESIDTAPLWPAVAADLAAFAGRYQGNCWASWGAYDRQQIVRESARHGVAAPFTGLLHTNLKAVFAKSRRIKQVGMATALKIAGLSLEGSHHRALGDALNIARLLPFCGQVALKSPP